jgi:hypothetical protein
MKIPLVLAGTFVVAVGGVVVARAQGPSDVGPPGMTAQTQEPPSGFTGACLLDHMTYEPTLPLICYAPSSAASYGAGSTTVTFPAKTVFRPYASLSANYDSYEVLVTCYPHSTSGACPQQAFAVSHSCCDYGASLTSLDGKTASGLAGFR